MKIDVLEFRLKLYPKHFDRVRAFYADTLGFSVRTEWNDDPAHRGVMFDTGSGIIELLSGAHQSDAATYSNDISLRVSNVHAVWEKFKDDESVIFPIRKNDWGDTSFCIADPEGFEITFFTPDHTH